MSYNKVVLLLGSNLNNPEENLKHAILLIKNRIGTILAESELVVTEAVEFDTKNFFCNIAISVETEISPMKLLKDVKKIENEMGRMLDSSHFGVYKDRVIDIDIIVYNNVYYKSPKLIIPHCKNLFERDFAIKLIRQVYKN